MQAIELENYQTQSCSFGWTCPNCGQWVPNNTYHYCNRYPGYYVVDRSQEIIDLLREILAELKSR